MRCASCPELAALLVAGALVVGCHRRSDSPTPLRPVVGDDVPSVPGGMRAGPLGNGFAYIPAACWTKPRDEAGQVVNPCYVCHTRGRAPNFTDDSALQLTLSLPWGAASNPWRNLFAPVAARAPGDTDAELLTYVRRGNYFDDAGRPALARALDPLPRAWDGDGDGRWDGYRPDAYYHFDDRGFDHRPDGTPTGWRAYTSLPVPGFFATNGSLGDTLIRLPAPYRADAAERPDATVYEVNLAIAEALVTRADVVIDPVDERALGGDLDGDGALGRATRIAFAGDADGTTRLRWVGRARREAEAGRAPIAVGLLPLGTELLHSVRYLDVAADGAVTMAARMKELRYARKARWLGWRELRAVAEKERIEQGELAGRPRAVLWEGDSGVFNGQGWLLQGFIEAADGRLRPQSYEETVTCAGCHGGVGATVDSTFSFARKLGGWRYPSADTFVGVPDPRHGEYACYLMAAGAGDPLRSNDEVRHAFFDGTGRPRAARFERLRADVSTLLLPSAARALALDRAYRAIVRAQSFVAGREALLAPATNVYVRAPLGQPTGVAIPLAADPR